MFLTALLATGPTARGIPNCSSLPGYLECSSDVQCACIHACVLCIYMCVGYMCLLHAFRVRPEQGVLKGESYYTEGFPPTVRITVYAGHPKGSIMVCVYWGLEQPCGSTCRILLCEGRGQPSCGRKVGVLVGWGLHAAALETWIVYPLDKGETSTELGSPLGRRNQPFFSSLFSRKLSCRCLLSDNHDRSEEVGVVHTRTQGLSRLQAVWLLLGAWRCLGRWCHGIL